MDLDAIAIPFALAWLLGCFAVGGVAGSCRRGFGEWFGLSLIASPPLAAILLVAKVVAEGFAGQEEREKAVSNQAALAAEQSTLQASDYLPTRPSAESAS